MVADIAPDQGFSEGTVRDHLSSAIGETGARARAGASDRPTNRGGSPVTDGDVPARAGAPSGGDAPDPELALASGLG